jgi:hypothetical protein
VNPSRLSTDGQMGSSVKLSGALVTEQPDVRVWQKPHGITTSWHQVRAPPPAELAASVGAAIATRYATSLRFLRSHTWTAVARGVH